jgi:hypothetical protein
LGQQTLVEILGTLSGAMVAAAMMLGILRLPEFSPVRRYVSTIVALRFAGALARYLIIVGYYGGRGDALRYHEAGAVYRAAALDGDFSGWSLESWSGTHAIELANAVIGAPAFGAVIGEFFIFSALGFVGLALCVVALRRSAPTLPGRPMILVMMCWPSLVFWPSSIGKEAVLLVSVGLLAVGLTSSTRRWGMVVAALALAFAIRPHVAALEAISIVIFDTLSIQRRRGVVVLRLAVSAIVAAWVVVQGAAQLGVDATEFETVTEEIQYRSNNTDRGGSTLGTRVVGVAALPVGIFNVLFRPLPFEANGLTMLIAAVEVLVLWGAMWRARRTVVQVVRRWRSIPFLVLGAGFGTMWASLIGVTFVNMGILARQRTLMMPFLVGVLALALALKARQNARRRGHGTGLAPVPARGHGRTTASLDVGTSVDRDGKNTHRIRGWSMGPTRAEPDPRRRAGHEPWDGASGECVDVE